VTPARLRRFVTATPLADLLAAVPSLNDENQPFTFAVLIASCQRYASR
jgi:hypothetical protein